MSDGSINFDTKVNSKGLEDGLKESQNIAKKQIGQIEKEINSTGKTIENLKNKSDSVNKKLEETRAKMDAIGDSTLETYKMFQNLGDAKVDEMVTADLGSNADYQKLVEQERELSQEAENYAQKIRDAESLQENLNNQLSGAKQELGELGALESQFNTELSNADYLNGIQSFQQYKQELAEITNRMNTIESIANNIANQNIAKGMDPKRAEELKQQLLGANKEYQGLSQKLDLLNSKQNKFNSTIEKGKGLIAGLGSGFKNVSSNINSTKKTSDSFGSSISSGIKKIAKLGLAVLSIRTAYQFLSQCANAWLNSQDEAAKQVSADLQYMQYAIGSMLAPALEGIVTILYKVLGVVASVVQALFGVNMFANASAKAYSNMAKGASSAAKETSKLASFDYNDVLPSDSGSSGGGGATAPSVDLSTIDTEFSGLADSIANLLSKIFEPFKLAWDTTGQGVIDSVFYAFESLSSLGATIGKDFFTVWTNGTVQKSVETILNIFADIFNIIGNIGTALEKAWKHNDNGLTVIQDILDIFNDILGLVLSIGDSLVSWTASESFQTAITLIGDFIRDIFDVLKEIADWLLEMYDTYVAPVVDALLVAISDIIADILKIWEVFSPIILNIVNHVMNVLEPVIQYISGLLKAIINIFRDIIDFITGIFTGDFEKCFNAIADIIENVKEFFLTAFQSACNFVINIFKNMGNAIQSIFQVLVNWVNNALSSIGNFLRDKFGAIGGVIADTISSAIKSVVNGILQFVEDKVNLFIGMINGAIGFINQIPGVSLGYMEMVQLPRLAKGAIVNNPGNGVPVVAGEAGPEAILPLNNNNGWMDELVDKTVERMSVIIAEALQDLNINLNFDGSLSQFVKLMYNELEKEKSRKGSQIIAVN